jgi:hypothetical protein
LLRVRSGCAEPSAGSSSVSTASCCGWPQAAQLDTKTRAEIAELAKTLQGNLDKIVHHGKRADAIVKNMLLHSREGSGEHRPVDVNNLVEESLNLA